MFTHVSIFVLKVGIIYSYILEAERNYEKPKLERNNIVNKGVWMRNKFRQNLVERGSGDFLFRPNSQDVDNMLQNNFDTFATNYMQDIPFVTSYVERSKRAVNHRRKQRSRKSMKNCKNKTNCGKTNSIDNKTELIGSHSIPDLKPASVFNDYPYEVAILLNNHSEIRKEIKTNNDTSEIGSDKGNINITKPSAEENLSFKENHEEIISTSTPTKNITAKLEVKDVKTEGDFSNVIVKKEVNNFVNGTKYNVTVPKRNKKHDYLNDELKKIEFVEDFNKTDGKYSVYKNDRGIFEIQKAWGSNSYAPDVNIYKVIPKAETIEKSKPVTERGLIRVISMLTKTFKKVMKQHSEIKDIHERLTSLNEDFMKNLALMNDKFQDFDEKYAHIIKYDDKLKEFDENLKKTEEYFKAKQVEMSKNLIEFENQQKTFLNQQKQFYTIQKLMLAQNEKINNKQNLIAKTQSEISHRQNNFARILKKAKQLNLDSKNPVLKPNIHINKMKDNEAQSTTTTTTSTTPIPVTESIKIDLFSIPTSNKLVNKDDMIIKDKDEQPIDDLVYKYYFNNTFIDNLMKSKILTNVIATPDQEYVKSKNKRNGLQTTILFPINDVKDNNRLKRSIIRFIIDNSTTTEVTESTQNFSSNNLNNQITIIPENPELDMGKENDTEIYTTQSGIDKAKNIKQHISNGKLKLPIIELTLPNDQVQDQQNLPYTLTRNKRWINHASRKEAHKYHHEKSYYLKKNHMKHAKYHTDTNEKQYLKVNDSVLNINELKNPFSVMATKFCTEIGQNLNEQVLNWCVEKALRRLQFMDTSFLSMPSKVKVEKPEKIEKNINKMDTVTKKPVEKDNNKDGLKITVPPKLQITPTYTMITEAAYISPLFQISSQDDQQVFFPDNEELESNLKQFALTPDTEGNVYFDGSLHASDIGGPDSEGSDILPGFESNSQMDLDPYALYLQAVRRASVRRINENILKEMTIGGL